MKRKPKTINKKSETLMQDMTSIIPRSRGNGVLKRQVWMNQLGAVTKYSLAYINFRLCSMDNGRVIGFDNSHGFHHKHLMGEIHEVEFKSFKHIEELFQKEFEVLHEKAKKKPR